MNSPVKMEVLFIVTSLIVSSTAMMMVTPGQTGPQRDTLRHNRGYFYAYNAYDPSGQHPSGPITFDTPDDITLLAPGIFPNFCAAADMDTEGNWYGCDYAGGLYLIDQDTGAQTYIGSTIGVNGMTYDSTTGIWYVISGNTLYTMDVTTGATSFIAFLQDGMGDIICNLNGVMYGTSYNGSATVLCVINKNTGMVEEIGPTGFSVVSDLAYDRNDDIVYIVGDRQSGEPGFYTCDVDTGECFLIGGFEGCAEIDGVVIPYIVPSHFVAAHFSWTPSHPNPGTTILFDASTSYAIGGDIILYEWDWNNDSIYEEAYGIPTVTHIWQSPGSYFVTLRVTDDIGLTATKSHLIEVIRENHPPAPPLIDGPTNGIIFHTYVFSMGPITDPDGDVLYCKWDWGDGNISDWLGPYPSGQIISVAYSWTHVGVYEIRSILKDIYESESNWSTPHIITLKENRSPETPTIEGTEKGKPGVTYLYVFVTTDPENDDVSYYIDWGDTTNSSWLGPYTPGIQKSTIHSWSKKGTYIIKVKAKDIYDQESDWGTFVVTMPYELLQFRFFNWFLERFPNTFPILRYLFGG